MAGTDFSEIAARYERDSLVQKSAAERLLGLLAIQPHDRVLDLGCGAGNLSRRLRALTDGAVVAVDPSASMIREAKGHRDGAGIEFRVLAAEAVAEVEAFSVIFCNSAFQWFADPGRVLANCFRALRPGGRLGIQAPATTSYCPNFLTALAAVAADPRTAATCGGFQSPWFFLETAEAYAALTRAAGFAVDFAHLEVQVTAHPPAEAMAIFESGAAAGYLNPAYYPAPLDEAYVAAFREIVARSFHEQAGEDGQVALTFNRIYLVARKEP